MKVVILAGGFGTRLSEETAMKPKPMVEIGEKPILWHIMKTYSHYGYNDFIICLGYKGYSIKEYFMNYYKHNSDLTVNLGDNSMEIHNNKAEPWKITLIDTGLHTMTGGRISRIKEYTNGEPFMLTYGDGVSDVNIDALVESHKKSERSCTVTAVQPLGRFGALVLNDDNSVKAFEEKPQGDGKWINGGFFVCEQSVFDYLGDDKVVFEKSPLENLARDGQLNSYQHDGFWKPMDMLRDKNELEKMWLSGKAPWKIWS